MNRGAGLAVITKDRVAAVAGEVGATGKDPAFTYIGAGNAWYAGLLTTTGGITGQDVPSMLSPSPVTMMPAPIAPHTSESPAPVIHTSPVGSQRYPFVETPAPVSMSASGEFDVVASMRLSMYELKLSKAPTTLMVPVATTVILMD